VKSQYLQLSYIKATLYLSQEKTVHEMKRIQVENLLETVGKDIKDISEVRAEGRY